MDPNVKTDEPGKPEAGTAEQGEAITGTEEIIGPGGEEEEEDGGDDDDEE